MEKLTIAEMKTCTAETLAYFIQTMPDAPFNEDDIVIEFAKQKDMAERAKALCELYVPDKIINETQAAQLNESIAANDLIGRDKSAVIAAINHKIDKQSWRGIFFHEFVHIYCAKLEVEGKHFIDVYGSGTTPEENPEDKIRDGFISSGYVVWSEFIAQYYAITKTENRKHLFIEAVEYIYDLLHEVSVTSLENSKGAFAQACAYWLTCRDAEETLDGLNDHDWFIPDSEKYAKETKAALRECLVYLNTQTKRDKPWKINESFIETFGVKFNMFRMMNSICLGHISPGGF